MTETVTSPFLLRNHSSSHVAGGCEEQSCQGPDRSTLRQTLKFILILPWNRNKLSLGLFVYLFLFVVLWNCVKRSKAESNRCFSLHLPPAHLKYASCSPTMLPSCAKLQSVDVARQKSILQRGAGIPGISFKINALKILYLCIV